MFHNIEYNSLHEEDLFLYNDLFNIRANHSNDEDVEIPLKVVVGLTGALAGIFIVIIPVPVPAKDFVGKFLITTGTKMIVDGVVEARERNRKNPKDKK